jgi:hypothetical protein
MPLSVQAIGQHSSDIVKNMEEVSEVWWADFHDEKTGKTVRVHTRNPLAVGQADEGLLMQWGPDGVVKVETLDQPGHSSA